MFMKTILTILIMGLVFTMNAQEKNKTEKEGQKTEYRKLTEFEE